ncbi:MAG TPA: bifunctional pyr operon transcriptional regulator/uracil phosphoribosyltransferase PyrR [candidate division Zixibacteria bacterium]|nr:bifunctional pyr operon transcriptional regulator/uracil phosphoribosyltransferase PyrR [candidate division Zixibacteria bacterium]MDD4917816.1 bifunctional pyr operon transcriptional regulator/uracil phosphoribosyltransferase PyrR [candidate division Zixibacteria bacterium]MDM7974208.1 bifunctional pyr operon transcriptional regulator/uracil phosphoribosyltransferase PyrR [candidate division Zixibacteria bacterium]HOD66069.1 bifunctional pyr operon transcriptional regulator/uracil phosphorib
MEVSLPAQTDLILDEKKIARALQRIAHEIVERNAGAESLVIIGVLTRGAFLARRIARHIEELEGVKVPVGLMDISLYRDDVHSKLDQPIVQQTQILFAVVDRNVILIDDVLFTGRTVRAALDQIIDFGRPRSIQLAVLVDRGHRELPFRPDYVGVNIPTARDDRVVLEVKEKEGQDRVYVIRAGGLKSRPAAPGTAPAKKTARAAGKKPKGKGSAK